MFEVIVQRSIFLKSLSHIQSVVERKNTSEISSHLKIEAAGTTITLTALDSTLSITTTITAEIEHNGALTLPVHTLYDIVRKCADETIQLKIDPAQPSMVTIISGYSLFHLPFLKAEKFPRIDVGTFDCSFILPAASMQKIIEKNRQTISQEDSRYHLNGIYIHPILETNELRGTATDGHRLSSTRVPLPKDAKNLQAMIIPRKTIFELAKIISDKDLEINIECSSTKIKFTIDDIVIISKLIEADFPDYLPLIPYSHNLFFTLPSVELAKAVDRVTIILAEKSQAIDFSVEGQQLEIQVGGDHQSLANEKLEVSGNLDQFKISFNAKYIMDILSTIGNNANIIFKFSDQLSPVLVQTQEDDHSDFVIMPMRG